jgi:hypothetical protein
MVPVEAQARFDLVEIRGDGVALIAGDAEDVGEAAAAGETTRCYLVELGAWCWGCGVVEAVPFCAADGKDVWTGAGEIDFEDYFGPWGQQGILMRGVGGESSSREERRRERVAENTNSCPMRRYRRRRQRRRRRMT